MTTRRRVTTLDKLKVMVRQARCPLCGEKLGPLDKTEFDHEIPLALGGPDTLENLRAVHEDCHAVKTTGRRGESDLSIRDGDQGRIAKQKRIEAKSAEFNSRLLRKDTCELNEPKLKSKSRIKSRPRPKAKPQRRASGYRRKGV